MKDANYPDKAQHIVVISQYFYPEQFRINDICKEWVKRGYKVTVITGVPNYPRGKFYPGYSWIKRRKEIYEGIHVLRLPIIPRGNSAFMLMLNYISFVFSGFFWQLLTKQKFDKVFIFEVSPMTQALVGVWLSRKKKIPCIIYVQDLWPENVEAVIGIHNKYAINTINKMVNYIYSNCTRILSTSPSFVKKIEERKSAWINEKSKVIYWPQYAEDFYRPVPRKELFDLPIDDAFKVIFTGNIGYAQGLDILAKVAEVLKAQDVNCKFVIVGDGRYREQFEKELIKENVREMFLLLGPKKPEEIPNYLSSCEVAFLSFSDNSLFGMTIPAKLQSYMACGMPIIAAATGETKRIIEEAKAGIVCGIGDKEGIVEAIKKMMKQTETERRAIGQNAQDYALKEFDKNFLLKEIEKYLKG